MTVLTRAVLDPVRDDGRVSRNRIIVASLGGHERAEAATLEVSHARLRGGDEVVHLGVGVDAESIARAAVAEDAGHVVLVGADGATIESVRTALDSMAAEDVGVSAG